MAGKAGTNDNAESKEPEIKFVTMVRDEPWPEPHEANVHPDEVQNYYSGGWVEKKAEAK